MMYEIIIVGVTPISDGHEIVKFTGEDGTELWIPMDEANADYQKYLAWVEENK